MAKAITVSELSVKMVASSSVLKSVSEMFT
jgi:hypothetical protein